MKMSFERLKKIFRTEKAPAGNSEILKIAESPLENVSVQQDVKTTSSRLDNVVVGEVIFKAKHPNADRLSITKVKIAEDRTLDIVCGAPNVEVGQKVAVALVGAVLPNGMKIEERKVRGENSCGMICAEDELGLGTSHEGIMVLDQDLMIGKPLCEALGI